MKLFQRTLKPPEGTEREIKWLHRRGHFMAPYHLGIAGRNSLVMFAKIMGILGVAAVALPTIALINSGTAIKSYNFIQKKLGKLPANAEKKELPKKKELAITPRYFSGGVFQRLSKLTGIPEKKLFPKTYLMKTSLVALGYYYPFTHAVEIPENDQYVQEHEFLHAAQTLLNPKIITPYSDVKYRELSARLTIPQNVVYRSYTDNPNYPNKFFKPRRWLSFRKAVSTYGVDGWIALHALGTFEPFLAQGYLTILEKHGYLHPPASRSLRGSFTEKGEAWIKTLAPQMENFLKQTKKTRDWLA